RTRHTPSPSGDARPPPMLTSQCTSKPPGSPGGSGLSKKPHSPAMLSPTLARPRAITGLASLWRSTIGKKYVMAISGLIWFGYLILHLWGNLKIYAGAPFLNDYAGWLRTVGDPFFGDSQLLWLVRIILIPAFI